MKHRPITYTNKPLNRKGETWIGRIILIILLLLILNNILLMAEGTSAIAPTTADEAALFIGAGNTGSVGGDYGQFAWKGSNSKLSFNIQNTCEKAYFGFSLPKKDRSFRNTNNSGGDDFDRNLLFRIIDPLGNPINNLSCFGNVTISGEVWQTLRPEDINLNSRAQTDAGPKQLAAGGYNAFELDLSACGLTLTGNYSIEFYTTVNNYNPNTSSAGFYLEYFDITVADCNNQALTGRLWSNNWCLAIKKDGDGPFDRAFNGAFYICSKEGFITKIDFNTNTNNRIESGKNNDQQSGFRAGAFNVSFNTTGPGRTGNIQIDRQSVLAANSPNPELAVFLNLPDPSFCPPQAIGDFKAKSNFISGCPNDYCLNLSFSKLGQIEVLIENNGGNRILDDPSEVRFVQQVSEQDRASNPEDPNFPYEICIPWDGKNGYGNPVDFSNVFISGFYFQAIYHFPVYDAEFNDDGFIVETVRPALGVQEIFYDDQLIISNNLTGENKDGTNGCTAPCHRWTGEYERFTDKAQIFGNFNTINTWWFGNSTFKDFSFQAAAPPTLVCPPDYVGCPGDDIGPNMIGSAFVTTSNPACTVIEYEDRVLSQDNQCNGGMMIERKWSVFLQGLENERTDCYQRITLADHTAPIITGLPTNKTVACNAIPAPANTITATDDCNILEELVIAFKEEKIAGACGGNYQLRRTWTATDQCGNSSSGTQLIMVEDNVAPVLIGIPKDVTVTCTAVPNLPNNITASDNCEVANNIQISFKEEKIKGACAGDYTLERIWTATDLCGNIASAKQVLTVVDNTPPELSNIPADETLSCDAIPNPATNIKASDNCEADSALLIHFEETILEGNCKGNHIIKRTWTATDPCGNSISQTQTLTIEDTSSPTLINIPEDITANCDAIPAASTNVSAFDNCVSENELSITLTESILEGECIGKYQIKRTWTATDPCGNEVESSQIISIIDETPPMLINVPNDVTVACGAVPTVDVNVSATDNCSEIGDVIIVVDEERLAGNCAGNYTVKRTWLAMDDCGNRTSQIQTITVQDIEAPTLIGFPKDETVSCDEVPNPPTVTATDNCEAAEDIDLLYKELRLGGKCANYYLLKRAWTATDRCGNVSFGEQLITVEDTKAPTFINCPENITVQAVDGCQSEILDIQLPEVIDNCENEVKVISSADLTKPFLMGTNVVIFTAIDDCGNTSTCEFLIQVNNIPQDFCPDDISMIVECKEDEDEEEQTAMINWEPPNGNECCSSCPINAHIDNFIFLGERGGHRYYYSKEALNWEEARDKSDGLEGYLAVINDPAENQFLSDFIIEKGMHIGLSDDGTPGEYYWPNDDELLFENWSENVLVDNPEETQFAQLLPSGHWTLTNGRIPARFIMEVPCMDVIQLEGPLNGSNFPVGTTTVAYLIEYDNCSNPDTCSFTVSIEECEENTNLGKYCESSAVDTTCFWIDKVKIGGIENHSGGNGGYGDFTAFPIELYKGYQQTVVLTPGYAPGHTFNVFWRVWIDFDQNGIFEESEQVFTAKEYRPLEVTFVVPSTAKLGLTRMRVAMNFVDEYDPCAELAFGEVEDYLINITTADENSRTETGASTGRHPNTTRFQVMTSQFDQQPIPDFTPMDLIELRKGSVRVFPNPTKNVLTLDILAPISALKQFDSATNHVNIFNQVGQIVYQQKLKISTNLTTQLDVSNLNNGIYFIQVKLGGTKTMKCKFVKFD